MTTLGSLLERCFYGRGECDTSGEKPLGLGCIVWVQVEARQKLARAGFGEPVTSEDAKQIIQLGIDRCFHQETVNRYIEAMRVQEQRGAQ